MGLFMFQVEGFEGIERPGEIKKFGRLGDLQLVDRGGPETLLNRPYRFGKEKIREYNQLQRSNKRVVLGVREFKTTVHVESEQIPAKRVDTEAKRDQIRGISRKSRRRMMGKTLNLGKMPGFFVTLTYTDKWGENLEVEQRFAKAYAELRLLYARVIRKPGFEKMWVEWRKEAEVRKSGKLKGEYMPHFHLVVGGLDGLEEKEVLYGLMYEWWLLTGNGDTKALHVCLKPESCQRVTGLKGLVNYISKYIAKSSEPLPFGTGRMWGFLGDVPWSSSTAIELDSYEGKQFKRLARRYLKSCMRKKRGLAKRISSGRTYDLFLKKETVSKMLKWIEYEGWIPF